MKALKKSLLTTAVVAGLSTLTACGGSSGGSTPAPVTPPAPANSAPTDIELSSNTVDENAAGVVVGSLSATDSDSGDTFTFSTDSETFEISGTDLKLVDGTALNFEQADSVDVSVTVTDSGDATFTKSFTVDVNDMLDVYAFNGTTGESSVSYSGQTARHVLINELNNYISSGLQADLDAGTFATKQAVIDKLLTFYNQTSEEYELTAESTAISSISNAKQAVMSDISSSHKNLLGKIAGQDATGQHELWEDGAFAGWGAAGSTTPNELVLTFFDMLATNAETHMNGTIRQDFNGNDITSVYVTETGVDLKQMIQKHLLMAVTFSQGADDYLDHATEGKGLNSDNSGLVEGKAYSSLEHNYDEGFGYFGAARDYLDYSDDEISSKGGRENWQGAHDTDGDGMIDLKSEYNFGASVNAAKRDLGTKDNAAATDFTAEAMNAFLQGRKIISDSANVALTEDQMTALKEQRDIAVGAWEKAIAATVVHYINDTTGDLNNLGTDDFSFSDLAKHYSEMKAFALGLQFSPFSPLSEADFAQLHTLMKDAPVFTGDVDAYKADLATARDLLQNAYSFDAENVSGW